MDTRKCEVSAARRRINIVGEKYIKPKVVVFPRDTNELALSVCKIRFKVNASLGDILQVFDGLGATI